MTVVPGIDALRADLGRLFVVVGVFDGLHLGHLYLLGRLREEAALRDARPAVITFDHHPDEVLTGAAPPLLCDPEDRLERLEAAGVAVTVVQHFDVALRMTEYDAFVSRIADRVDLAGFLMTPDSAFGHERRGTPAAVADLGYAVVVIPAMELRGQPVRSGEIRAALAAGELERATDLLGRPYAISGSLGAAGDIALPMPVALPPPGRYGASISEHGHEDRSAAVAGLIVIDDGGAVRIAEPPASLVGRRVHVRITASGPV
jgi:riboflavin kinase / FMN adenylyltransferase